AELLFQRPQLQAYRRLAEEQRLGRARYRAQPRHLAKRSQLLQPAALVVVARVRTHRRGVAAAAPPAGSDDGADERRATAAVPATAPRGPGGRCGAHSQAIESAGSWRVLSALERIILRDLINCIDIFALANAICAAMVGSRQKGADAWQTDTASRGWASRGWASRGCR